MCWWFAVLLVALAATPAEARDPVRYVNCKSVAYVSELQAGFTPGTTFVTCKEARHLAKEYTGRVLNGRSYKSIDGYTCKRRKHGFESVRVGCYSVGAHGYVYVRFVWGV